MTTSRTGSTLQGIDAKSIFDISSLTPITFQVIAAAKEMAKQGDLQSAKSLLEAAETAATTDSERAFARMEQAIVIEASGDVDTAYMVLSKIASEYSEPDITRAHALLELTRLELGRSITPSDQFFSWLEEATRIFYAASEHYAYSVCLTRRGVAMAQLAGSDPAKLAKALQVINLAKQHASTFAIVPAPSPPSAPGVVSTTSVPVGAAS